MALKIGFRCDGNSILGMGHISRCLGLAEVLRDQFADQIRFYLFESPLAAKLVELKGFQAIELEGGEFDNLQGALDDFSPQLWVIDERRLMTPIDLLKLKSNGAKIALIDDLSEKRLNADLLFYPPISQVTQLNWEHFLGEIYTGWEWVLLKPEFSQVPKRQNSDTQDCPRVLITCGGSDPWGFTPRVLVSIDSVEYKFEINVVVNRGFLYHKELDAFFEHYQSSHPIKIIRDPFNMRELMQDVNLAIASFGVTAYELAATGVPAILICPTKDHLQSALTFESGGLAAIVDASTGIYQENLYLERQVRDKFSYLITKPELLINMGERSRGLCAGDGAYMIAAKLHEISKTTKH